jgi:hypothetical protein
VAWQRQIEVKPLFGILYSIMALAGNWSNNGLNNGCQIGPKIEDNFKFSYPIIMLAHTNYKAYLADIQGPTRVYKRVQALN